MTSSLSLTVLLKQLTSSCSICPSPQLSLASIGSAVQQNLQAWLKMSKLYSASNSVSLLFQQRDGHLFRSPGCSKVHSKLNYIRKCVTTIPLLFHGNWSAVYCCWAQNTKVLKLSPFTFNQWNYLSTKTSSASEKCPYSAVSWFFPTCVCRTCVSHCPLGHYEDIASRRCRRCYKGCERCVGRSAGDCLSCRRGLYLSTLNSSCIDTCHPDYFADESKSTHPQCRPNSVGLLVNIWYAFLLHGPFLYFVSVLADRQITYFCLVTMWAWQGVMREEKINQLIWTNQVSSWPGSK